MQLMPMELRIGSSLAFDNPHVRFPLVMDITSGEDLDLAMSSGMYFPISITPERLLLLDFKEVPIDHPAPNHRAFEFLNFHVKIYNSVDQVKIWYYETVIDNVYYFIHQLQNLVFDHAGVHITLKNR